MKCLEAIFWGLVAAFSALIAQTFFSILSEVLSAGNSPDLATCLRPSIVVLVSGAAIEEFFKAIILYKRFGQEKGVASLALALGLGFALIEAIFLIQKDTAILNNPLGLIDLFSLHILSAGIIGLSLRYTKNSHKLLILGYFLTFSIHLFHNWIISEYSSLIEVLNYAIISLSIAITMFIVLVRNNNKSF